MPRDIATIGVYGTTENSFFDALKANGTTHFVDIRRRRGLRGHEYAYANSAALQTKLSQLGITYLHDLSLAASDQARAAQKQIDQQEGARQRSRDHLSDAFKALYRQQALTDFDPRIFLSQFQPNAKIVLFCVEHSPYACHRSLVAESLAPGAWHDLTP